MHTEPHGLLHTMITSQIELRDAIKSLRTSERALTSLRTSDKVNAVTLPISRRADFFAIKIGQIIEEQI